MQIGEKSFELDFKYYQLKKVAVSLDLELHEVPEMVQKGSLAEQANFGVKCILHGCDAFASEEELEKAITDGAVLFDAAKQYMEAFAVFFGIKGEEAKTEAH